MGWNFFLSVICLFCGDYVETKDLKSCCIQQRCADDVIAKAVSKILAEKDLVLFGHLTDSLGKIRTLTVMFNHRKCITIQEGRKLLVFAVQSLLSEINADEVIRPHLQHYPFQIENVEVGISLEYGQQENLEQGELWGVAAHDGVFKYLVQGTEFLEAIHEETYEEALQLVEQP